MGTLTRNLGGANIEPYTLRFFDELHKELDMMKCNVNPELGSHVVLQGKIYRVSKKVYYPTENRVDIHVVQDVF